MRVDVHQPGLNVGDANGIVRGLRFAHQGLALEVGLQYDFDQAFRAVGSFLRQAADPPAWRDRDGAGFGGQFTADRVKQR